MVVKRSLSPWNRRAKVCHYTKSSTDLCIYSLLVRSPM